MKFRRDPGTLRYFKTRAAFSFQALELLELFQWIRSPYDFEKQHFNVLMCVVWWLSCGAAEILISSSVSYFMNYLGYLPIRDVWTSEALVFTAQMISGHILPALKVIIHTQWLQHNEKPSCFTDGWADCNALICHSRLARSEDSSDLSHVWPK